MKKLLKSEVCGSREQCTVYTVHGNSQQSQLEKKKKKQQQTNKQTQTQTWEAQNALPKRTLNELFDDFINFHVIS